MAVDRWNRAQLVGKGVHWLVDVIYAGRVFRVAQTELDVTSADLGDLHYSGDLGDVSFSESFDFLESAVSAVSVAIRCVLPGVDVAEMVARGHDITAATGELSKWIEGTDYEDRKTMLVGAVRDPEYGGEGVELNFSIEENLFEDAAEMPSSSAEINAVTINSLSYLDTDDLGIPYPIILGQPGKYEKPYSSAFSRRSPVNRVMSGSQAVWRSRQTGLHELVIAEHHVKATKVWLQNDGFTTPTLFEVVNTVDQLGQEIATVSASAGAAYFTTTFVNPNTYSTSTKPGLETPGVDASFRPAVSENVSIYVSWYDPTDGNELYGGAIGTDGNTVRDAGDVIDYVLGFTSMRVDRNKMAALKSRLSQFKIDCCIDARVKPWDWIKANLLPILPISVTTGPAGLAFIYWDYSATAEDAIGHLDGDADPQIEFAEYVKTDTSQIKNQLSMRYALSVRTGSYAATARLGPVPSASEDSRAVATLLGYGTVAIRLTATTPGAAGEGIVISVTGPAALAATEDLVARTVAISVDVLGADFVHDLIDEINASLTSIRATLVSPAADLSEGIEAAAVGSGHGVEQEVTTVGAGTAGAVGLDDYFCRASQARYRNIVSKTGAVEDAIESIVVYDSATAHSVLQWRAKAFAFATRTLEALVPENDWDWLERGSVVIATCARLHLVRRVCLLQEIESSDDGMLAIRLLFIEDPARDNRYGV